MQNALNHNRLRFEPPPVRSPFFLRSATSVKRIDSLEVLQRVVRTSWGSTAGTLIETRDGHRLHPAEVLRLNTASVAGPRFRSTWIAPSISALSLLLGGVLAVILYCGHTEVDATITPQPLVASLAERPVAVPAPPTLAPPLSSTPRMNVIRAKDQKLLVPTTPRVVVSASQQVAHTRNYHTAPGTELKVSATDGILGKTKSTTARALLRSSPKHGRVRFFADGHFSYRPQEPFTGDDSFLVEVVDGTQTLRKILVSVAVRSR